MSLLAARDVSVAYGGVHAVDGVSLDVSTGEALGLIGPNGAGKSSLLAALGGQVVLAGGSITLDGDEIGGLPAFKRARRGITRTFQMTSEFARMTVFENLVIAGHGAHGAALRNVVLRRARRGWPSGRSHASRGRSSTGSRCRRPQISTAPSSAADNVGLSRSCAA